MIGDKSVTLDTDQPAQSQSDFTAAMEARDKTRNDQFTAEKVTPLAASNETVRGHIADEVIRLMRVNPDKTISGQVDTEEKAKAEREFLLALNDERLLTMHKRYAGSVTVAKPQTTTAEPDKPEGLDPEAEEAKKLQAKFEPPKDTRVTLAIV